MQKRAIPAKARCIAAVTGRPLAGPKTGRIVTMRYWADTSIPPDTVQEREWLTVEVAGQVETIGFTRLGEAVSYLKSFQNHCAHHGTLIRVEGEDPHG